jgi:hypothetical protein
MGKIGKTLFGSPATSKSSSSNVNNGMLSSSLGGALGGASEAHGLMSSLLNGGPGGFADSGGFKFLLNQGTDAVNSNMSSRGLLNSGADMKGIEDYRNNLASTYLDKYLGHVNDMGQLGLGAGGILADSGKVSSGSEKGAKKGIAGTLVKAASLIPGVSDPRLKTDIKKVGEYSDGLGRYQWTFVEGMGLPSGRHEGVMADEVKMLRPWAYIPNFLGEYAGVDYGKLEGVHE